MNDTPPGNQGIVTFGGTTQVVGSAVGDGATVNVVRPAADHQPPGPKPGSAWQIGVVTILAEETRAVVEVLGLHHLASEPPGRRVYGGRVEAAGASVTVVASRALDQGPRSTMATVEMLWRRYRPSTLVLVGIGGGIHRDVAVDDVVVATRVVYYDQRKETPEGALRRGGEHLAPMAVVHAVNAYFNDHGQPAEVVTGQGGSFRVFHGPIGSGDAVIADRNSEIRKYLSAIDYRVLAVDMEAGGLSQFCYETAPIDGITPGWAVIRGISDHADDAKDDAHHHTAARHAALTLRHLIPYLGAAEGRKRDG